MVIGITGTARAGTICIVPERSGDFPSIPLPAASPFSIFRAQHIAKPEKAFGFLFFEKDGGCRANRFCRLFW